MRYNIAIEGQKKKINKNMLMFIIYIITLYHTRKIHKCECLLSFHIKGSKTATIL